MKSRGMRVIRVRPTGEYPCAWDDLIGPGRKTLATIYALEEGKKSGLRPGITKGKDGVYDIVLLTSEINNEVVRDGLKGLEKITGKRYILEEL